MDAPSRPPDAPGGARRGVSRRTLLIGGAAVAAVAVGVPGAIAAWPRGRSLSVDGMRERRPFTVAHRGGSADWPEMSAFAYERSVAAGVDALEMSVSRTSDGVWVGVHDGTLDRTSGTSGFVVAEHTWAEVQEYRIRPPSAHPDQPSRPYERLEDLIDRYRSAAPIWIDPKAVAAAYYPELMKVLLRADSSPADAFVAKSEGAKSRWARLARAQGMQTWGFYYGADLEKDPGLFARTQASWTMLGLDWAASDALWRQFTSDGRPVVAHVLATRDQRDIAIRHGAHGLMIAGITEISADGASTP